MISPTVLTTLEKLLRRLPFHIDDIARVNACFADWRKTDSEEHRKMVDLWTYCFVWRNLLVKFSNNPKANPADFDILVAKGFERIVERRHTIRDANKYANWVSVVCRNVFINYLRKKKKNVSFDENIATGVVSEPEELVIDTTLLIQVLERAILRLPKYLQDVATLRILEQQTYEEISHRTGKRVEIIRSYMNKAKQRLIVDEVLSVFIKKEFREDTEN